MVKVIWRETGSPQLRIPDQFRRVPLAVDGHGVISKLQQQRHF